VSTERVAYRASDEFAAAYRAYHARYLAARAAALAYDRANPDHPLHVRKSNLDQRIDVYGFGDVHTDREPPEGLSRRRGRDYLVPKRGRPGDRWRAIIAEYGKQFPDPVRDVFTPHQVPPYIHDLERGRAHTPGIYDFGERGVYVLIGREFDDAGPHLARAPLSEYYAAKEFHELAAVSDGR
jgi:hypothetical protein